MSSYYEAPGFPGDSSTPKKKSGGAITLLKVLAGAAFVGVVIGLFLPATRGAREPARRAQCVYNLKQIALALRQYESTYHALPPACTVDAAGRPLHSWRTLILPYLGQAPLYETIDLTKPWDDPANAKARETPVGAYRCPEQTDAIPQTSYLALVAPGSCFLPDRPRRLSEVTDDHGKVLMVIEAAPGQTVPWMCPRDADASLLMGIEPRTVLNHSGGINGLLVDGSVWFLRARDSAASRRALISIAGNDDSEFNH